MVVVHDVLLICITITMDMPTLCLQGVAVSLVEIRMPQLFMTVACLNFVSSGNLG